MEEIHRHTLRSALGRLLGCLPKREIEALAARFHEIRVAGGDHLYHRDDPGTSFEIVLAGRLEVRPPTPAVRERRAPQLAKGDCVGEIALLTGRPRTADVVAIRETVLARLTREAFDNLMQREPQIAVEIARSAVRRLVDAEGRQQQAVPVRNIAVVPLDPEVPTAELVRRLEVGLLRFGRTIRLDERTVRSRLSSESELDPFLDDLEASRRFVLLEGEVKGSSWTRKCLSQADRVLLVARASSSPDRRALEEELLSESDGSRRATRELVLVHPSRQSPPNGTAAWLAARSVDRHHHLDWRGNRGILRLARSLSGSAVNLVLGGGGARGFAQIGAIRALREAGIPIDAAGGVSMGAVVAAQAALEWGDETILQSSKRAFVDERPLNDYTIPLFGLLRGEKVSRGLRRYFGEVDIVDLWAPFFCLSSNLSRSERTIHRSGPLWKALRASVSLPGILPPLIYDGELHVDGGILDNLPVSVMQELYAGLTIAIDTSVPSEYTVHRDTVPSPWEFLRDRALRGGEGISFPTLGSLITKATTLAGSSGYSGKAARADLYLNPPMEAFDFLAWDRIYEIAEVGYRYTRERLPAWIAEHPEAVYRRDMLIRRYSWKAVLPASAVLGGGP